LCAQKKLEAAADEEQRKHPDATVEIWAMDEHRIGLKPIVRGVWAKLRPREICKLLPSTLPRARSMDFW